MSCCCCDLMVGVESEPEQATGSTTPTIKSQQQQDIPTISRQSHGHVKSASISAGTGNRTQAGGSLETPASASAAQDSRIQPDSTSLKTAMAVSPGAGRG